MSKYSWALNPQKLARAIGNVGLNASEDDVKKNYIAIGGKVALSALNKKDIMQEEEKVEDVVEETPVEEAPTEGAMTDTGEAPAVEEVTSTEDSESVPSTTDDTSL